jgi:hypothetical protein
MAEKFNESGGRRKWLKYAAIGGLLFAGGYLAVENSSEIADWWNENVVDTIAESRDAIENSSAFAEVQSAEVSDVANSTSSQVQAVMDSGA